MSPDRLPYLLLNTPLTDPTTAYHSISYLVGAATQAGYTNYTCLDANITALNHLAQPSNVDRLLGRANLIRHNLEQHSEPLTRHQQLAYRYALKAIGLTPTAIEAA